MLLTWDQLQNFSLSEGTTDSYPPEVFAPNGEALSGGDIQVLQEVIKRGKVKAGGEYINLRMSDKQQQESFMDLEAAAMIKREGDFYIPIVDKGVFDRMCKKYSDAMATHRG